MRYYLAKGLLQVRPALFPFTFVEREKDVVPRDGETLLVLLDGRMHAFPIQTPDVEHTLSRERVSTGQRVFEVLGQVLLLDSVWVHPTDLGHALHVPYAQAAWRRFRDDVLVGQEIEVTKLAEEFFFRPQRRCSSRR